MNIFSLDRTLRLRIAVAFVNRFLDAMITTFMAVYLAQRWGAAGAGMLLFAVVTLGAGGMFVGGHLSDTRGRRPTLLLAEAVAAASFALMALGHAGTGGTLLVYLGYLIGKLASSVGLPANDAMIVDITTPENRTDVYTINYWATNLALAGGSLLGGFLYNGHFTLLLAVAAAATGAVLLSTALWIPESRPEEAARASGDSPLRVFVSGYYAVARDGVFLRFVCAATLGLTIEFQLANYIGVRLSADFPSQALLHIGSLSPHVDGVQMLGLLRSENTILVVLLALFSGTLFKRMPDPLRLYTGIVLFTAGYMVLAVSNRGWVLVIAGAVFTIGELMNVPVKQALLANMIPSTARPKYMAVYNLSIRVAQMLASLCITLAAWTGPWGMFVLYGAVGLTIVLLYRSVLSARSSPEALVN
ncbi:MFS transporter [Streptomyces sp. NPDC048110]|uniref:MFS transporter n=1 Tax=Streptomyces sp. NPDC048110 TaxID=3155483 RepID=UPI00340DF37A